MLNILNAFELVWSTLSRVADMRPSENNVRKAATARLSSIIHLILGHVAHECIKNSPWRFSNFPIIQANWNSMWSHEKLWICRVYVRLVAGAIFHFIVKLKVLLQKEIARWSYNLRNEISKINISVENVYSIKCIRHGGNHHHNRATVGRLRRWNSNYFNQLQQLSTLINWLSSPMMMLLLKRKIYYRALMLQ